MRYASIDRKVLNLSCANGWGKVGEREGWDRCPGSLEGWSSFDVKIESSYVKKTGRYSFVATRGDGSGRE